MCGSYKWWYEKDGEIQDKNIYTNTNTDTDRNTDRNQDTNTDTNKDKSDVVKRPENTNTNTENRILGLDECDASDDMKRPQCKNNAVLYKWSAPHVMIKRGSWGKQSFKDKKSWTIKFIKCL